MQHVQGGLRTIAPLRRHLCRRCRASSGAPRTALIAHQSSGGPPCSAWRRRMNQPCRSASCRRVSSDLSQPARHRGRRREQWPHGRWRRHRPGNISHARSCRAHRCRRRRHAWWHHRRPAIGTPRQRATRARRNRRRGQKIIRAGMINETDRWQPWGNQARYSGLGLFDPLVGGMHAATMGRLQRAQTGAAS